MSQEIESLLFKGDAMFSLDVNGVLAGYKKMDAIVEFAIIPEVDQKKMIGKGRHNYGMTTNLKPIPKATNFKAKFQNFNAESLAIAFLGEHSILAEIGGTVSSETVTSAHGIFVNLASSNLAKDSVVIKDSAGVTTYVENVDYEINYSFGMIMALSSGAITSGQSLKATYQFNAKNGSTVIGGTKPEIRGSWLIDGVNMGHNNEEIQLEIPMTSMTSKGGVEFFKDDFGDIGIEGEIIKLPNRDLYTLRKFMA